MTFEMDITCNNSVYLLTLSCSSTLLQGETIHTLTIIIYSHWKIRSGRLRLQHKEEEESAVMASLVSGSAEGQPPNLSRKLSRCPTDATTSSLLKTTVVVHRPASLQITEKSGNRFSVPVLRGGTNPKVPKFEQDYSNLHLSEHPKNVRTWNIVRPKLV